MARDEHDPSDSVKEADSARRRFVVLHHVVIADSHYDLMIEDGAALATWRLATPLCEVGNGPIAAVRIGNHRRAYLEYEGPLSGNRGVVTVHERGMCQLLIREDRRWLIEFHGEHTRGGIMLQRVGPADSDWQIARLRAGA